ncbi:hypothetical protein ACFX13_034680 [Malus domestica]
MVPVYPAPAKIRILETPIPLCIAMVEFAFDRKMQEGEESGFFGCKLGIYGLETSIKRSNAKPKTKRLLVSLLTGVEVQQCRAGFDGAGDWRSSSQQRPRSLLLGGGGARSVTNFSRTI